ncbi:MAG TPA: aryl-sulfate sulfotransferase [Gemmataceae bacterium]|jgi:hypothetical protein|nr:aryl-sulfate sulfotransferase [Gemmataceae bacterium]
MLRHFCGAGILVLALGVVSAQDAVQPPKSKAESPKGKAEAKAPKLGLLINDPKAFQGYTVLATQTSGVTYLIDMQGKVVRKWEAKSNPALCAYLLENGNLLRPCTLNGEEMAFRGGPGAGGRVQEFTWDGELIWDFKLYNEKQLPHHDITRLPNGNVLMIVWDKKTSKEALAAGRRPELVGDSHLLPDSLIEIKPTGKTTAQVVWEWHLWDHLVQEHDKTKANYGKVAEHPELVNVNYGEDVIAPVLAQKGGADKLKSIGYVGSTTTGKRPPRVNADWTHFNCVAYNPDLDQIAVSVHSFSEFWIIDHSTTTAEAAGHSGGRSGKGGDLLYRWGNPRAYGAGTKADQRLFAQHNAHWIPRGLPGEGHLLVFNNGNGRPGGNHSSVDELVLPADAEGRYDHKPGAAYGPDAPIWSYAAPKKSDFYSFFISGAQRLPNGNTLICSGANGTIFEVTPDKEIVWKYVNPVKGGPGPGGRPGGPGGPGGFAGPPQPGQILPSFMQGMLNLTADQKKQLEALQKDASARLDKMLTDEQKKELKEMRPGFGAGGSGSPPQPGQILSPSQQASLKLTPEAKKQLQDLQKEADAKLDKLLTADQKKQFKDMRTGPGRGGPGGFGPGGPGGFGPGGGSALFRAYRYAPDYAGLVGKDLKPGKTIEELQPKQAKGK